MLIRDLNIMARLDAATLETANLAVLGGTADGVNVDVRDLEFRGGAVSLATSIFKCCALRNGEGCPTTTFQKDVGEVKVPCDWYVCQRCPRDETKWASKNKCNGYKRN